MLCTTILQYNINTVYNIQYIIRVRYFSIRPLIVGDGAADAGIRGLAFDSTNTLYGAGSSLWELAPFQHRLSRLGTMNNSLNDFCFINADL